MGNILRQGIAAYQQTMNPKAIAKPDSQQPSQGTDGNSSNSPAQATKPVMQESIAKAQESIAKAKARMRKDNGLLKTVVEPKAGGPKTADSKIRRVAKFFILIGSEQAAKILGELDGQYVEAISKEIALIERIDPVETGEILAEFKLLFSMPGFLGASSGGIEAARRILHSTYGPEKGEALLNRTVPGSKENIFGFLEEYSSEQLVFLLKDEQPGTAALVLARLPAKVSAEAIGRLDPEFKTDVLLRIARRSEVSPEVLESVAGALREKADLIDGEGANNIEIDGMQKLAAILKQGDYSFGDRILNELEMDDPEIGMGLKNRLYTLDDVLNVFDRPLAEKLKRMNDKDIAILLKGRSIAFREKILSNVSSGRRHMIHEESEILGPVSRRECDEVANNFIAWFRHAREKGSLALSNDEDWVT